MLSNIYYEYPQTVYLLIMLIPIWYLFWRLYRHKIKAFKKFNPTLKNNHTIKGIKYLIWINVILLSLSWIMATLAIMGPKKVNKQNNPPKTLEKPKTEKTIPHEIVFMVDVSASMSVEDAPSGKSRLEFAKEIVKETTNNSHSYMASLYAFTSELTAIVPQTYDLLYLLLLNQQLTINTGDIPGTDFINTISTLLEKTKNNKITTFIILSDGGDTYLETIKENDRKKGIDNIVKIIEASKKQNHQIYTVGIGTTKGDTIPGINFEGRPVISSLNSSLLTKLAEKGQGKYFQAYDNTPEVLAKNLVACIENTPKPVDLTSHNINHKTTLKGFSYKHYFKVPLSLSFLLLILDLLALPLLRKFSKI